MPIRGKSKKTPKKTIDSVGGDTLWIKILGKPNYYIKENFGAMSFFDMLLKNFRGGRTNGARLVAKR